MLTKTYFAAMIAASLLIAPLGVAYAVGTENQKKTEDVTKAPNAADLTEWTKEEAIKNGITEQQFNAADKNHDGKLNKEELKGAGLEDKMKTSK